MVSSRFLFYLAFFSSCEQQSYIHFCVHSIPVNSSPRVLRLEKDGLCLAIHSTKATEKTRKTSALADYENSIFKDNSLRDITCFFQLLDKFGGFSSSWFGSVLSSTLAVLKHRRNFNGCCELSRMTVQYLDTVRKMPADHRDVTCLKMMLV